VWPGPDRPGHLHWAVLQARAVHGSWHSVTHHAF